MAHRPDTTDHYDTIAVKRLALAICGQTLVPKKEPDGESQPR